jgi:Tfp pilus assembly PilM family ATPase
MLRFLARKPCLGIEINSSAVRVAAVSGCDSNLSALFTKTAVVPVGVVGEAYASPNIQDFDKLSDVLRECLAGAPNGIRRTALSLPDGVFRVQALEFDELPGKAADLERLIRWRIEKSAAIDISETTLRYQVLGRQDKGFTVLSCVAKQSVLAQFESLLLGLGLEPWAVGLSSFNTLNLYSPYLMKKSAVFAMAHMSEDSFATIIMEKNGVRFYRYKDVKRGKSEEIRDRLMREIDDSLHFYTHMGKMQQSVVRDLYLTGESAVSADLAEVLRDLTSLNVEVPSPAVAALSAGGVGPAMAAALGAGSSL